MIIAAVINFDAPPLRKSFPFLPSMDGSLLLTFLYPFNSFRLVVKVAYSIIDSLIKKK